MRRARKQSILPAILLTAGLFGLVHVGNFISGADPFQTLIQVVDSACAGVLLGALYLLTGNLLVPIAAHVLQDVVFLSISGFTNDSGLVTRGVSAADFIALIPALLMCGFVLWFLSRERSRETALRIWTKKWNGVFPELPL